MDIRKLTDDYAVAPQIDPGDAPSIAEAGYAMVICNRPDAENPPGLSMAELRAAVEQAGMTFVDNAFSGPTFGPEHVEAQASALQAATGPVLAYCATGNRSAIVWALAEAGRLSADEMIANAARHGYQLEGLRPQIEARARRQGV